MAENATGKIRDWREPTASVKTDDASRLHRQRRYMVDPAGGAPVPAALPRRHRLMVRGRFASDVPYRDVVGRRKDLVRPAPPVRPGRQRDLPPRRPGRRPVPRPVDGVCRRRQANPARPRRPAPVGPAVPAVYALETSSRPAQPALRKRRAVNRARRSSSSGFCIQHSAFSIHHSAFAP